MKKESGVESERTGARKTHQIESVRGRGEAATGSVEIPVKSSLEEEISRVEMNPRRRCDGLKI